MTSLPRSDPRLPRSNVNLAVEHGDYNGGVFVEEPVPKDDKDKGTLVIYLNGARSLVTEQTVVKPNSPIEYLVLRYSPGKRNRCCCELSELLFDCRRNERK